MNDRVLAGRFHLRRLLGRGGMAEVYAAYDEHLDREVAIKVLLPRFTDDEAFQERFTNEGRRAAGLNHPNIVTVLDTGYDQDTGLRFIVMELVQGRSLYEAIQAGGLTEQRALEVTADVCAALQYAHDRGLVHRDVKPGNIMLADDGTVKVTDFGIARAIDSDSNVTQTAAVLGTAAYLSPEQAQGRPVDVRTDIYSLGIVLYELLTGVQPFQGDTAVTVAYQHVQEQPRRPRDLNPDLSEPAEAICIRAIAKNPANRYGSAAEFRDDLLRALAGHDVTAPAVLRAEDTALLEPVGERGAVGARSARRRQVLGFLLLGLGSLVAAGLAVFLLLQALAGDPVIERRVPEVVGLSIPDAQERIRAQGLEPVIIDDEPSDQPVNHVARQEPPPGDMLPDGSPVRLFISSGPQQVEVPPIVGLEQAAAETALRELGLLPDVTQESHAEVDEGLVVSSDPPPGERVETGTTVRVVVSAGRETQRVRGVRFMPEAEATLALEDQRFNVLPIYEYSDTVDAGLVIRQEPAAGTELEVGSDVTIVVSRGPEETEEPSPSPTTEEPSPTQEPTATEPTTEPTSPPESPPIDLPTGDE